MSSESISRPNSLTLGPTSSSVPLLLVISPLIFEGRPLPVISIALVTTQSDEVT